MTKNALCQEKFGFGESQDFDISQQLRFNITCMILAYHNSQNFARLADQYFSFCPEYQMDCLYRDYDGF